MNQKYSLKHLTDSALVEKLNCLVSKDRERQAELLAHIGEVQARKLYLAAGYGSMYAYCRDRLHMSEAAAYERTSAARAARQFPIIFDMIARGDIHLSGVAVLAKPLTEGNHKELLGAAKHQTKHRIEELVKEWFPSPDATSSVRKLPQQREQVVTGQMTLAGGNKSDVGSPGSTEPTPAKPPMAPPSKRDRAHRTGAI